jgi:hypothetical protein
MTTAGELKYTGEIKRLLVEQIENPTDDFVRFFASKVFDGPLTPTRREYFSGITKRSFNQVINERINVRLKSAMSGEPLPTDSTTTASVPAASPDATKKQADAAARENAVETTAEELEGFYIIKSLLRDMVDPNRIVHRDTASYMGILLDDNNRKPLARLYFNRTQRYIGTFDEKRSEERVRIENLNDIYQYAEKLRRVFAFYESEKSTTEASIPRKTEETTAAGSEAPL